MTRDELAQHLEAARERVEPRWDEAREAHVRAGLPERARRHRRRRVALGAAGVLVVSVVAALVVSGRSVVRVEPLEGASVASLERTRQLERFRVETGGAWFEVEPGRGRVVRVEAQDVVVEVVGTRFLVERVEARVHVVVEHGVVRASAQGVTRTLEAGASAWFPEETKTSARSPDEPAAPLADPRPGEASPREVEPAAPPPEPPGEASPRALVEPTAHPALRPEPPAPASPAGPRKTSPLVRPAPGDATTQAPSWKALAQAGDFDTAWTVMKAAPAPRDEPAELLLAADVARLSRHPEEALAPLRRILEAHAADPRAPLAAFTLGRVLLDDLGRPREAAAAFERTRTLAPQAPLAEDAFARQVEALSRAQSPEARALAEAFERQYPASSRLRAVRHFGGLQ